MASHCRSLVRQKKKNIRTDPVYSRYDEGVIASKGVCSFMLFANTKTHADVPNRFYYIIL